MSEPLLRTIINLFAIVAKEDLVTADERKVIEDFLLDHLSRSEADKYLTMFDQACEELLGRTDEGYEKEEIGRLCRKANEELTIEQKIVMMMYLIELILADGTISESENRYVQQIGYAFNIDEENIIESKLFVLGEKPEDFEIQNIMIIDNREYNRTYTFKHWKKDDVPGRIVIYQVPQESMYFLKYRGQADLFLNGIAIKQGKIYVFSTGSNIRSDRMSPIYYSDILSRFVKKTDARITFEVNDISYQFRNGNFGLRNVTFSEESGKLLGIMGASGAGKSTLLNVLNGNEKPSKGHVLINGINIHEEKEKIEGVVGFVPQDDLLMEELTVYQNLYFAAKLSFSNLSDVELDHLVDQKLSSLGLYEIKDLKVGSPLEKTISGGQRKRLNIGLELLREPAVLFLDEPTSGLSSRDSENIMDLLKELALKGKLIFVVIHQPSSDIFKMFDRLIILDVGGYPIYYGDPVEAVIYFKRQINLINAEQGECIECGNVNPEQIFNIIETRVVNEYGRLTTERKISPEHWHERYKKYIDLKEIPPVEEKPVSTLNLPNLFRQFQVFLTRDLLSKVSNRQYMIINLLEAPVLAFLLGYIVRYWNVDDSASGGYRFSENINIPSYLFMSVIVALFMGLTVSAEEIIRDRKILKRETFLNLSKGSYLTSKIVLLFSLSAVQTLAFVLVGHTILEIKGMYLTHWLILFSTSCFANVLGLNISSAFNSVVTIYILIPILIIPQLLLSGVVVKFDKINPSLTKEGRVPLVGDIMASRWAFEAAMVSQFRDNEFSEEFYPYEKRMAKAEYKKVYFIPKLESKLDFIHRHLGTEDDSLRNLIREDLALLRNELGEELNIVGREHFKAYDQLTLEKFSEDTYRKTYEFLEALRQFYSNKYTDASMERDSLIENMTSTPEGRRHLELIRNNYYNHRISDIVKNIEETHRVLEKEHSLIQKIYPIYMDPPTPDFALDFRTQFYVPNKYFAGMYVDTVYFNVIIIWIMSIILIITLYFDVLRKFIHWISNLS